MATAPLRIVGFTAENYKRLKLVELTPPGGLVEVAGPNESGKTSLGDAIWAALEYAKHVQKTPIRKGQKKARIEITLGTGEKVEYIVRRTFNAQEAGGFTTAVIVEKIIEDGVKARLEEPQKILNNFIGALAMDPIAFMAMKPREQFDALKGFVPGVDFDALAAADETDREERLLAGRDAKALRARANAIVVPADAPLARVDEKALVDELAAAGEANAAIDRDVAARASAAAALDRSAAALESMKSRRVVIANELLTLDEDIEKLAAHITIDRAALANGPQLRDAPLRVNTGAILEKIDKARTTNAGVDEAARLRVESAKVTTEAEAAEGKVAALTKQIEAREAARRDAIAKAKMPVAGITFGDGVVLYNDLPLDQASGAQQVLLCVSIVAAMNPRLPVIWIKNGNDLDEERMAALRQFAADKSLQIWVERVGNTSSAGVIMEDGHLAGVDPTLFDKPAEEKP